MIRGVSDSGQIWHRLFARRVELTWLAPPRMLALFSRHDTGKQRVLDSNRSQDMNKQADAATAGWKARIISPLGITSILLGLLLLLLSFLGRRDDAFEQAMNAYEPFATPAFDIQFNKDVLYDPRSFVGRGRRSSLWEWSQQDGVTLTRLGANFFTSQDTTIVSTNGAGRRRLVRILAEYEGETRREIEFDYEWTEISPPAAALLSPAPRLGESYYGRAVVIEDQNGWSVDSFETRDFDESLDKLRSIASGQLE
jgi:hypothetical protein